MKYRKSWWCVMYLLMPCLLQAQVRDTLADIKMFVHACNAYKQIPLQLEVFVKNTCNIPQQDMDTSAVRLLFAIQEHGSYLQYGEVEQLANDSMVLMISHKAKQMIAMPSGNTVARQLLQSISMPVADSSITRMAAKYTAVRLPHEHDTVVLVVTSRALLPGTAFPKECIIVRSVKATGQLVEVKQMKRTLYEVDEEAYRQLQADSAWNGRLTKLGEHFMLVKELIQTFCYKQVKHDGKQALPLQVNDCVSRSATGKLLPAAAYEGYLISENNQ
ncbi:hypothetical protein [Filimonas lacunae]|nr:hypothetical protein [Filimonas lacunae]BAV06166.1 hypothetical protein FLA_2182 [Filimonas lacunae]